MAVLAKISKFGNSKGIRLPKVLLQQSELGEIVELVAKPGAIMIRRRQVNPKLPYAQTKSSKQSKNKATSHKLTDFQTFPNDFDDTDWTW
jgi:antitoxin component of MazEF toxin-antitoxin module